MVKKVFFCLLVFFFFLNLIVIVMAAADETTKCIGSSDNFATEVLLNKPGIEFNISSIENAGNVAFLDGNYIFKSRDGNALFTFLAEKELLSLKLQLPTKKIIKEISYYKITSTKTFSSADLEKNINGWIKICEKTQETEGAGNTEICSFEKENIEITIKKEIEKENGVSVYIDFFDIEDCNILKECDGKCIYFYSKRKCIPNSIIKDINSVLLDVGLENFDKLIISRKTQKGTISVTDIVRETNETIDWQKAMSDELYWLRSQDILRITETDMKYISGLSDTGRAGNKKIIYGENPGNPSQSTWMFYNEIENATLEKSDCKEFPLLQMPLTGVIINFKDAEKIYTLIPFILGILTLLILLILLILAKIINVKKTKRKKRRKRISVALL